MTDNSTLGYPADYYYPEFIYSRPDEPPTSPTLQLPVTSVDNGIGSSINVPTTSVQQVNEARTRPLISKQQSSSKLAGNVITNQGLPGAGMTETVRADAKADLVRDPAERNMPKLIVDDSIIQQTVRTSKSNPNYDGYDYDQTGRYNQFGNGTTSLTNGHSNGDITNNSKFYGSSNQQPMNYTNDEQQPVDDRWKKEVFIDDQGVVTIEPVKYEEPVYDGPFGLTRTGSYIFYIGMAVFTLIAAVFLIMTGVFYARNYPDASTNPGKLAGIGICAFAFYLGLQLILIGIWHQKHRQENPRSTVKPVHHDQSQTRLKSTKPMTNDNNIDHNGYDFAYQPQIDYTSYDNHANGSYVPYGNEQMAMQGAPPANVYYQPIVWPPGGEQGIQLDPKFYQPMESTYGSQAANGPVSTAEQLTTSSNDKTKNEKKSTESRSRKKKNAVEVDSTKTKSNKSVPKSTVIEPPLPRLNKAPETKEIIEKNAELENNGESNSSPSALTVENVNRIKTIDDEMENSSLRNHRHRHSDRHHHNRHSSQTRDHHHHHHHRPRPRHQHRRRQSHSPCSICSRNEFHSDVSYAAHRYHHYVETLPAPIPLPSTKMYRESGVVTDPERKTTRDTSVSADLEDVSVDRGNSFRQVPVVHRTVIVEPYPAEPSSQIIVTSRPNRTSKFRSDDNQNSNENRDKVLHAHTTFINGNSKRSKSITDSQENILEDLNLEDVNETEYFSADSNKQLKKKKSFRNSQENIIDGLELDDVNDIGFSSAESRKRKPKKLVAKKPVKNAFYN